MGCSRRENGKGSSGRALTYAFLFIAGTTLAQAPVPSADGTTPLHQAVRANDLATVQRLLKSGASPSAANRYGITPLYLATENANAEMVGILLKAGAHPKATLPGGQTLLMSAARTGNAEALKMFLDRGADPNTRETTNGETALMWAASQNHPETVKALIARGAEVNTRSMLHQYRTDRFGLEGVVTILPKGSLTPLMFAARDGAPDAALALTQAGADVNLADPDGTTALLFAISNGHYDTAAVLLDAGADPNLADTSGTAALYAAVDMSTLIEIYGRPRQKTNDKLTALELIAKLLDKGARVNAQLKSATLQRAHTPGDGRLGEGTTPLMRAARNGDAPAMRLLLARGADPNLQQKTKVTALILAAGLGRGLGVFNDEYSTETMQLEAVKVLLDQKVDVNAATETGQTALHYAALTMDSVVELLAKNGANVNAKDNQGRTPLDMANGKGGPGRAGAAAQPRPGTVALLRRLGATS